VYDDDCLGTAARHSLDLCCGRLHSREDIERPSAVGVVVGFEEENGREELRRMPESRRCRYARGGKRSKRRRHAHCCNEQYATLVLNGQLQLQEL
jgi:hypothetical protein